MPIWPRPGGYGCAVRDSKAVTGPAVLFSLDGWTSFVTAVKKGRLPLGQ